MASKKAKELSRAVPQAATVPVPGFWDTRVLPLLEKRALAIALCCMAIGSLRIAATWTQLGLTYDEPQHFACGLGLAVLLGQPLVIFGLAVGLALAIANHRVFQSSAMRFTTPEGVVTASRSPAAWPCGWASARPSPSGC